jgi:DNA-binding Lrp family transcriptional regulator
MAVRAFVLVSVETARTREVVETLRVNPKLKEVHEVLGPYDLVAFLEASELDDVTRVIRNAIRTIPGVRNTTTCVVMD